MLVSYLGCKAVNFYLAFTLTFPTLPPAPSHTPHPLTQVLSWLHPVTHASITRCSQPLVGAATKRSTEDETYFDTIYKANNAKKLYIMDARPKINAVANLVSWCVVWVGCVGMCGWWWGWTCVVCGSL